MASTWPPVRGVAFTFEVGLVSQADTDIFVATPTLAAGDIQVSKDGGQFANLATFPPAVIDLASGADSGILSVVLTAAEMTADRVAVHFHDAAGNEWQDVEVTFHTSAQSLDTVDANVDAILLDTGTTGVASVIGDVGGDVIGNIVGNVNGDVDGTVAGVGAVARLAIADDVWDELLAGHLGAGSTGAALNAAGAAGDPWITALPGGYVAGSAGKIIGDFSTTFTEARAAKLDLLGAGGAGVTMISPVSIIGDTVQLVKGDGYYLADGRSLQWSSALWPDLTGAAITLGLFYYGVAALTTAGVVVTGGVGITQTVSVDVTEVQTALLAKGYPGTEPSRGYSFDVEAVLLSGHSITLQRGTATVLEDYTP